MSLLNKQPDTSTLLALTADQILNAPLHMVHGLVSAWEGNFKQLWQNHQFTPAEILAQIGTDAKELFELNTALVHFLLTLTDGKHPAIHAHILQLASTVPPHTVHKDGTITIDGDDD